MIKFTQPQYVQMYYKVLICFGMNHDITMIFEQLVRTMHRPGPPEETLN